MPQIPAAPPPMMPPRPASEARAAFFRTIAAPAPAPAPAEPRPAEAAAPAPASSSAPAPERIARPGSIIDIKV